MPPEDKTVRTTFCRKKISRTLKTAEYFSLTIGEETEDEIEWTNLDERDKKLHNLSKCAIRNFKRTHDEVLEELGLAQIYAFGKDHLLKKKTEADIGLDVDTSKMDEL